MRRCLQCHAEFQAEADGDGCPACGHVPGRVDGFLAFSPQLAHGGGGFKAEYYAELAGMEGGSFWFRARNALLLWAMRKYCPDLRSMLEIGCGTAYVLSGVAREFPHARFAGSEIFVAGLAFAAKRLPSATFFQMDARDIPFRNEFDLVGAFDVLEHIEDDRSVLSELHAALRPGGCLLLTVPQHPWLWSDADAYACHVRRYSAAELHKKVRAAGFEIVRSTSFVTALLPAMTASRLMRRKKEAATFDPRAEFDIAPWLNTVLERALQAERAAIRAGLNLPVGGSRLVVARRSASTRADGA